MLEEKIKKIKLGYKASSELIKEDMNSTDEYKRRLLVQRSDAIADDLDTWESLGYLSGVAYSFLRHPYKTYKLLKNKKAKMNENDR